MDSPLKILLLEDSHADAEIIQRLLQKDLASCEFNLAMNKGSFLQGLEAFVPDLILSDNSLPGFDAYEALKTARQKFPDIPFIMVTGMVSEEFAANIIKSGADDYILKDRMVRLPEAIETVLIKKQAERDKKDVLDRLISSEERYRTVIERISDGFIALDLEWNITYINAIAEDMFRQGSGALTGKNLWQEFPLAVNKAFYNAYYEALKAQRHIRLEDYSADLNRWLEIDIYPSQSGVTIYFRDISEQRLAEIETKKEEENNRVLIERMSAILNTLPANIALLDDKGLIVEVNECWKEFAEENGFIRKDYGVGMGYMEISKEVFGYDKKDEDIVATGVKEVLKRKVKEFEYEYSCRSLTKVKRFRMVITPLKQEHSGAVAMHIDISELRRLEKEKIQGKIAEQVRLAEAILSAQEEERNFIAQELHDNVNQILVGTKLILSSSKSRPDDIQSVLQSSIDNIQLAIDENRKIAHELGSPDFETKVLTEQILALTENMLGASGIKVRINTSGFEEELIDNEHRLAIYRITQEHCTNIVKYAKATQVDITLTTNTEVFNMLISDNGIGMEAGKNATGIGLKNIKGRLSVLHGVATIETEPGKGFTLGIEIPLR